MKKARLSLLSDSMPAFERTRCEKNRPIEIGSENFNKTYLLTLFYGTIGGHFQHRDPIV